jgi:hypothetical protein
MNITPVILRAMKANSMTLIKTRTMAHNLQMNGNTQHGNEQMQWQTISEIVNLNKSNFSIMQEK